jgi:hypothetical protein
MGLPCFGPALFWPFQTRFFAMAFLGAPCLAFSAQPFFALAFLVPPCFGFSAPPFFALAFFRLLFFRAPAFGGGKAVTKAVYSY